MFGKMKREKTNSGDYNNQNVDSVIKPFNSDNENRDVIHPIIFTSIGNCRSIGLSDFPLEFSRSANSFISENQDKMLDPIIEKSKLIKLDQNNKQIAITNIVNYILQNSFMSICSALNSSKYASYFNIIPVLPYIQEELFSNGLDDIKNALYSFIYNNYDTKNMDSKFHEEFMIQSITYANNISMQIAQMICTRICLAAEKAITEVGMQVHVAPGINDLYRKLSNDFSDLKAVKNEMPQDFNTHCTILLKQIFRDILQESMFTSINRDISQILLSVVGTLYFTYNDYLYYDFDAAREQLIMETKRQRKMNNNDIL